MLWFCFFFTYCHKRVCQEQEFNIIVFNFSFQECVSVFYEVFFLLMLKVKKHHNLVYKIIYNSINIFHKNYQRIHLNNNTKKLKLMTWF